jgi:RES domain-containing protein
VSSDRGERGPSQLNRGNVSDAGVNLNEYVQEVVLRATSPGRGALELPLAALVEQRYHRVGEPVPVYASRDRRTVELEMEKKLGVPLAGASLQITELSFEGNVYDAISTDGQRDAGVTRELLTSDDYSPCHQLMDFVKSLGDVQGLLVPSAVDPHGTNLVVLNKCASEVLTVVRTELIVVSNTEEE